MRKMFKLMLTLGILSMVVSLVIAFVYIGTKDRIQAKDKLQYTAAIMAVLPGMERIEEVRSGIYQGVDNDGNLIGYATMGSSKGYGGPIKVMVGVSSDRNKVLAIKIVQHKETPGLGDKIVEIKSNKTFYKLLFDRKNLQEDSKAPWFCDKFKGKSLGQLEIVKQGNGSGKIDAITGATVSSAAVVEAVKDAMEKILKLN